jgi:hypothetical protein
MSQMTSAARTSARTLNRPSTPAPRLRVVTGAPLQRGGAAFGIICATLLAIGLVGLLILNTALSQGSFTLHDLRATSDQLSDSQDALTQSLDVSRSPASLATRASKMGMVPGESAAFLRLSDGKVVGVATPATRGTGFTVVRTTAPPVVVKPVVRRGAKPVVKPSGAQPAPSAKRPAQPASAAHGAAKPAKR